MSEDLRILHAQFSGLRIAFADQQAMPDSEVLRRFDVALEELALTFDELAKLRVVMEAAKAVRDAIDTKSISIQFDSTDSIDRLLTSISALESDGAG